MEELKNYRVTAGDGKILFCVFCSMSADVPKSIDEKRFVFINALAISARKRYGELLLDRYEQSEDRLKRIRIAPVICKITERFEMHGTVRRAFYDCFFSSCGKVLYSISFELRYDEDACLFLSVGRVGEFEKSLKKCEKMSQKILKLYFLCDIIHRK